MKLSKQQLKRIIRKTLNESDIYPRPQHPMIANAGKNMRQERRDTIADELTLEGMSADRAIEVAEMILNRLIEQGLISK